MLFHLYPRGWAVLSLILTVFFIVVSVPAVYIPRTRWRTIYVSTVTPVVWVLYNLAIYFILYRPLRRCTEIFNRATCCKTEYAEGDRGVPLLTKEMYQLNNCLHALKSVTTEIKVATVVINRRLDVQMKDSSHPFEVEGSDEPQSPMLTL